MNQPRAAIPIDSCRNATSLYMNLHHQLLPCTNKSLLLPQLVLGFFVCLFLVLHSFFNVGSKKENAIMPQMAKF